MENPEKTQHVSCIIRERKKRKKESREALNQTGPGIESTGPGQSPLGVVNRRKRKKKSRGKDTGEEEEQRKT